VSARIKTNDDLSGNIEEEPKPEEQKYLIHEGFSYEFKLD